MLGENISSERYTQLLSRARQAPQHWFDFQPNEFATSYNLRPFLVSHRLPQHPQFSLPALFALCRRLPRDYVKYRFGVIPIDADIDTSLDRFRADLTLNDAIDRFEEKQAYIAIYNPEVDAEYRPTIEGLLGEIGLQTDPLDPGMSWYSTYIFISARDSVTPYHMDREMNFLLQVRGTKTVQLWDPFDDVVMTSAQKDNLLSYTGDARPPYHAQLEAKAMTFELRPGLGVHHPFIAPHLVRTGPEVSISLAITFRTRQSDIWTAAHRINHGLRGLGLSPRSVRRTPRVDRAKAALLHFLQSTRSTLSTTTQKNRN